MKRVLVTGATGFIGRACLRHLRDHGYEVHAVSSSRASDGDAVWHRANLLDDPTTLVRELAPSHLLHLAWYAVPGKYWTSRENLRWVYASLALYDAFVSRGGRRVVMAGTSAEYDWSTGTCREGVTPLRPRTYYGTCKKNLGELVLADAGLAQVSAAWARYFFLYGEHEYPERLIASTVRALLRGETARCSPGTQRRDFMHVDDAAAATVALLDGTVEGAVNIASGAAVSVRSLVERARDLIGTGTLDLGALPADPDPLIVADVTRLRDEVGYVSNVDPDERLRATIEWWRTQSR